jgi:hypothetical protein
MPGAIARHVPGNNATLNAELFSAPGVYARSVSAHFNTSSTYLWSLTAMFSSTRQYALTDPVRQGLIQAFEDVMFKQVLAATIVAIVPPLVCLFLTKRIRLEDVQNLADGRDLAGKKTEVSQQLGVSDDESDIIHPSKH